jgi:benzoate membrane transport protein
VSGGLAYLVFGVFAGAVMGLFALLPPALIAVLAGLALFPVVAASLAEAVEVSRTRDAAVVTFAVSASGLTFLGLGAAFWGLILGLAIHSLMALHAVRAREG